LTSGPTNIKGLRAVELSQYSPEQLSEHQDEQQKVRNAERAFRGGQDIDCLVAIFSNLMKVGATPSIECISSEVLRLGDPKRLVKGYPVGYKALRARLGYYDCLQENSVNGLAYAVIHDALLESGFPVRVLHLGGSTSGVPFFQFSTDGLADAYCNLVTLSLQLSYEQGCYSDDAEGDECRARDLRGFIGLLESAQGLRTLSLKVDAFRHPILTHSAAFAAVTTAKSKVSSCHYSDVSN